MEKFFGNDIVAKIIQYSRTEMSRAMRPGWTHETPSSDRISRKTWKQHAETRTRPRTTKMSDERLQKGRNVFDQSRTKLPDLDFPRKCIAEALEVLEASKERALTKASPKGGPQKSG